MRPPMSNEDAKKMAEEYFKDAKRKLRDGSLKVLYESAIIALTNAEDADPPLTSQEITNYAYDISEYVNALELVQPNETLPSNGG